MLRYVVSIKKIIPNHFLYFIVQQVLNLEVSVQSDGSPIAIVQVGSQQEAQFTISQLHRQKLGPKRIIISYSQNNSPDPEQLRAMVIEILQVSLFVVFLKSWNIIYFPGFS